VSTEPESPVVTFIVDDCGKITQVGKEAHPGDFISFQGSPGFNICATLENDKDHVNVSGELFELSSPGNNLCVRAASGRGNVYKIGPKASGSYILIATANPTGLRNPTTCTHQNGTGGGTIHVGS